MEKVIERSCRSAAMGGAKLRRTVKWYALSRYEVVVSTTTSRLCPKGETTKRKARRKGELLRAVYCELQRAEWELLITSREPELRVGCRY